MALPPILTDKLRLPVIASRIIGTVGLLGPDYPGYYPASDTEALGALLWRAEQDPDFLARLRQVCAVRADLFRPDMRIEA